ncbi:MAG: hypothetical protein M0R70_04760 [Nitrospirae bacterium]|nr:hypothetical protein [Nitrospirota bacterium]
MSQQNGRKWKNLITFVAIVCVTGCAPSAYLTVSSVPNPVLLAGPSHIETYRNDVDVEVLYSHTETWTDYGYGVSAQQTTTRIEGPNKASAAVFRATQGNDALDVHVSGMQVGAWVSGLPFFVGVLENWINIKGGVAETGKDKK